MEISERVVGTVTAAGPPDVTWFATRQPGLVAFLERRFEPGSDLLAVALAAAATVHAAYEATIGRPPARAPRSMVERAEAAVLTPAELDDTVGAALARQPALASYVASVLLAPPLPLAGREIHRLGVALAAVVAALEEASGGPRAFSTPAVARA